MNKNSKVRCDNVRKIEIDFSGEKGEILVNDRDFAFKKKILILSRTYEVKLGMSMQNKKLQFFYV